jgi:hypothetical protein
MLSTTGTNVDALANTETGDWYGFEISGQAVDLDQAYAGVVPGSWLALANTTVEHLPESQLGYVELYLASEVSQRSRSDYGLASKVTHVELDSDENLSLFDLRNTLVLAESERLPLAEPPLRTAVFGDRIELASKQTALARRQPLAVAGARQHLRVRPLTIGLTLSLDDGGSVELVPGDRLTLLEAPARTLADGSLDRLDPDKLLAALDTGADEVFQWTLADRDGRPGRLAADAGRFAADPAEDVDPVAGEIAFVADAPDAVAHVRDRTHLRLQAPLRNVYDRATVTVNANVAPATHGETVTEIVGSGDASQPDQRFPLKQVPLTYVRAPTPSGRASTLAVRVEGALWQEHATLYGAGPADHDYSTETADAGTTTVVFGDGVEGARLPTGSQNVSAAYRKGIGAAANVRAGQLTTLLARPLGVTEVVNPEPATGGQDPEALADARTNAPRTVLTLDRAVSVRDYEDFARAYAGIAKAQATWVATGPLRGIVLTVAGPEGAAIDPGSSTGTGLKGALHDFGDALTRVTLVSYRSAAFVLHATVKVRDDLIADEVLAAARATLVAAFSFVARDFGQRVTIDEVVAVLHRTVGIVAVDVNVLRRSDQTGAPAVRPRLESALPLVGAGGATGAELLTVDADALELGVMA